MLPTTVDAHNPKVHGLLGVSCYYFSVGEIGGELTRAGLGFSEAEGPVEFFEEANKTDPSWQNF
jgi:hypothetical protein